MQQQSKIINLEDAERSKSVLNIKDQFHDFIILGAGISGLQAGLILAQHQKDFIILEATNTVGGRIGTQTLGQVICKQALNPNSSFQNFSLKWIDQDPNVLKVPIEYGATWIAKSHKYMKRLCKQLDIQIFPQFKKGQSLYGVQPGTYVPFENLYPQQTRQKIKGMLSKINKLKKKFNQLYEQVVQKQYHNKKNQYRQFINTYDTISVKQFIQGEIKDKNLSDQLLGFIQCLQCIDSGKFSMMQLIDDDDSLAIVEQVVEQQGSQDDQQQEQDNSDDGFRVKTGTLSIITKMVDNIMELVSYYMQNIKQQQIIRLNSPVFRIQPWLDKNKTCRIYVQTNHGIKTYQCKKIFNGIPLATMSKVEIVGLSKSKQIIFNGQEPGIVYRVYMVFSDIFWREKFSGYGAFSPQFAFNQMTDISPADNSCGVLAFVFYADRYQKWQQSTPNPVHQFNYIKRVVADMFLNGNINSEYLTSCITYTRTFTYHEYIKAAYQPTTKIGVWKAVDQTGDQYTDSFSRDQNGIYYIGSEMDEQFGSYMQGSLRTTRKKVYQLISKPDPWKK